MAIEKFMNLFDSLNVIIRKLKGFRKISYN